MSYPSSVSFGLSTTSPVATLTAMLTLRETPPSSLASDEALPTRNHMAVPFRKNLLGGLPMVNTSPPRSQSILPPYGMNVQLTDPFAARSTQAEPTSLFNPLLPLSPPTRTPPLSEILPSSTSATAGPDLDMMQKFERVHLGGPTLSSELIDTSWPARFPPPELLHHLVDTFFACVPHARRVLHRPTFMNQLLQHPNSTDFPYVMYLSLSSFLSSVF